MTFQGSSELVEIDSDCYHMNTIVVNNVMDVSCIQRGGHRIHTPPPIDIIREYEEGQRLDPACNNQDDNFENMIVISGWCHPVR